MRRIAVLPMLWLAVMLVLGGCSSGPQIRVDVDPGVNPASFRSFGFFEPLQTDKAGYSTLVTARLKESTRRELESRGYAFQPSGAEMLVNFNINIREKTEIRSSPNVGVGYGYYGYRAGRYGAWAGYPYDIQTTNYREGTLTIDVVETARSALIWQGVAEGRVRREAIENPAAAIDEAVKQILADFPVR